VQFLAINANRMDTAKRIADHAAKYRLNFPVLKDEGNKVADAIGARRTPEAFLLDGARKIRYQGRIDDQYGIATQRPKPTRRDLAVALDEILAGKMVSVPTTAVAGCKIARVRQVSPQGAVTFNKQVSRILQKNCQECHRPGQIGPMALLTYEDATAWAETIREVIHDGRMPPWHADPRYGKFRNDRRLADEDKKNLLAWLDGGTPRGSEADAPPPVKYSKGWAIGKPDVILTMPQEFEVPAKMPKFGIPYQHFYVDTNFTEDKWIVAAEAKAGAPEVVHHIIVFVVPPGERFIPRNPNFRLTPTLCGLAPGDMPMRLAPGMAKRIPKGSRLVFQMHYTPNGKPAKDRSSVSLVFGKGPPNFNVQTQPIYEFRFRIPAGADNHKVESRFTFAEDGYVLHFMPHMHLRGKDFLYEAIYPDGKKETLLSVPRFNFNWQTIYLLEKPLKVPRGTVIHCVAHFDNSDKNANNPDPTKAVYWGDQTWEEMMIGWMDYAYEHKQ